MVSQDIKDKLLAGLLSAQEKARKCGLPLPHGYAHYITPYQYYIIEPYSVYLDALMHDKIEKITLDNTVYIIYSIN